MTPITVEAIQAITQGTILWGEKDATVTWACTDSREVGKGKDGCLFVAIPGERVDGHDFLKTAKEQGAVAALVERPVEEIPGLTVLKVPSTIPALQALSEYYRAQISIPVVGVTGSVGKTTTKEMISAALQGGMRLYKTPGNRNSQIGLALSVLELEKSHQGAVLEMGMSEPGEMERLSRIAKPSIGVVTNIGVSHLAQLHTRENIRKEKLNLVDDCAKGDLLLLNGDDPLLKASSFTIEDLDEKTKEIFPDLTVKYYGLGENCEIRGEEITYTSKGSTFSFQGHRITLQVPGEHNVQNALAALGVAKALGVDLNTAAEGLASYRPLSMRGVVTEHLGYRILDDTYNASPDSMKSALKVLNTICPSHSGRRIAVLADALELGEESETLHREVGYFLGEEHLADLLVTVGPMGEKIAEGAKEKEPTLPCESFSTKEEAVAYLKQQVKPGDGILVKGSRGMHMEKIVEELS